MATSKGQVLAISGKGVFGKVANYSALPAANLHDGETWIALTSQGTKWLPGSLGGTWYDKGQYYSDGTTWIYDSTPYNASQSTVNTGTNDDQFITASTLKNSTQWGTKQDVLISGTTIKTINGVTILGSGNIVIAGAVWGSITGTLSDQTDLQNALNAKQNSLGFTPYNATNPAGYISGITSGNVTTALGYTPINPNGTTSQYFLGDGSLATKITNNNQLSNGSGYITTNQTITLTGDVTGSGTTSITTTVAATIVKTVVLNTPGVIFTTPVTFTTATNTATGSLALATQTANTILAGPASGGVTTPTFRALVAADIPAISLTTGVSGILPGTNGGTGVNNSTRTITIGGNLTTTGAFNTSFTQQANVTITLPPVSTTLVGKTGTAVANQIPYYSDANQLTTTAGLTYNGTDTITWGSSSQSVMRTLGGSAIFFAKTTSLDIYGNAQLVNISDSTNGNPVIFRFCTNSTGAYGLSIGVNPATPTAKLQIAAGTATASTAPLKFTSGTLMTTPEVGAIEFLTDDYYATITTGAARKGIVLADATLTSGRVSYNGTNGRQVDDANFTYAGTTLTLGGTHATINVNGSSGTNAWFAGSIAGTTYTYFGASGANDGIIGGSTLGDFCFRAQNKHILFSTNGGNLADMFLKTNGCLGIGHNAPTARLHPKASTGAANTAPFKLTAGTLLTTKEAGTLEYVTGAYVLQSDALRLQGSVNNAVTNQRVLYVSTTGATATELTFDGAAGSGTTNRIVVPANTAMSVVVNICVKQSGSANSKQMLRQFLITNNAGTTTIEGTVTALGTDIESSALATAAVTITANDTDDCMKIEGTGIAATNLRWTAFVVSTEVIYA